MKHSAGREHFTVGIHVDLRWGCFYFGRRGKEGNQAVTMRTFQQATVVHFHLSFDLVGSRCGLHSAAGSVNLPGALLSHCTSCWNWYPNALYGWVEEIFPPPHVTGYTCRNKSIPLDSKCRRWQNFPLLFSSFTLKVLWFLTLTLLLIVLLRTRSLRTVPLSPFQ